MPLKLIRESTQDLKVITEAAENGNKQNYFIEGIWMQANQPNKNGRLYPGETLFREVRSYIEEKIKNKRSLGELGHPETPIVNLDRVSHLITELRIDGDNVVGRAKILNTPNGKVVQALIDDGVMLGVSTRGLGSISNKGQINEVQDDFILSAVDIVSDPSAPDAFVQGIREGKEWTRTKDGQFQEMAVKELRRIPSRRLEKWKINLFEKFLSEISKT